MLTSFYILFEKSGLLRDLETKTAAATYEEIAVFREGRAFSTGSKKALVVEVFSMVIFLSHFLLDGKETKHE